MNIFVSFLVIFVVFFGVFFAGKRVSKKFIYTKEELVKGLHKNLTNPSAHRTSRDKFAQII